MYLRANTLCKKNFIISCGLCYFVIGVTNTLPGIFKKSTGELKMITRKFEQKISKFSEPMADAIQYHMNTLQR
jgi:hypothetical protein